MLFLTQSFFNFGTHFFLHVFQWTPGHVRDAMLLCLDMFIWFSERVTNLRF